MVPHVTLQGSSARTPHPGLFARGLAAALAARLAELDRPDRTPEEDAQLRRLQALVAGRGRTTPTPRSAVQMETISHD